MGHKDYTIIPEIFVGKIPTDNANEIADLYAQGKSINDIQGLVRVNGSKLSPSLIITLKSHIERIESTCVNLLNGTSLLYSVVPTAKIPNDKTELLELMMMAVSQYGEQFTDVYEASMIELIAQVGNIIDNIIKAQNGGNGIWDDLKNAVPEIINEI